ncbi:MAG TPA: glycoside hydrolase family 13 protein [Micromonosporaceae bacterium]|nr:glycoside hydrolase family 13 protein [Micromonosporaceae bacterium]
MSDRRPDENAGAWWRSAAIYQVYVRSFADGDGDGIGDIAGIRARLGYVRDLGVDAIWLNPWYVSPQADAGYDVADYRDIDPVFGTLAEAEALIAEAHELGIRVIVDIVPNHCSDQHPWFRAALASGPGSAERRRFVFRPGRGVDGEEPPNNWPSNFAGSSWTRVTEADGAPGEWYLHQFAPEQPDFNWANPEVHAEFEALLRFWLDRGVDGFRIDVAHGLVKAAGLADAGPDDRRGRMPFEDQDGVHDIWREWRRITDSYPGERVLVGEVWVPDPERFSRYLRRDELHSAFNFDFLRAPWGATPMRAVINETLATHALVGAPATWVLSNHDVPRHVTRYGRVDTSFEFGHSQLGAATDRELGTRRARAAALLTLALPGGVYVYQGDELGLSEIEDIPDELRQDPMWERSGHLDGVRDGCRVPMPWSGDEPPFGFSPDGSAPPWLPQPADWKGFTVAAQVGRDESMLSLYRDALRLRRTTPGLGDGPMAWVPSDPDVLAFTRGDEFACVVNMSNGPVALPPHEEVMLTSGPLDAGLLPTDTAVWLRTAG